MMDRYSLQAEQRELIVVYKRELSTLNNNIAKLEEVTNG